MKGCIKHYNPERGFGFISVPASDDVFFHYSALNFPESEVSRRLPVVFETAKRESDGRIVAVKVDKA